MSDLDVQAVLSAPRTDSARLQDVLETLRARGVHANGFDACCVNCGWRKAVDAGPVTAVMFSTAEEASLSFAESGVLAAPLYFQWWARHPGPFLALVAEALDAAGFDVVVPTSRAKTIEVHPR